MSQTSYAQPLVDFPGWRRWVRDRPIAASILVGIVATQMCSLVGYFMNAVGLPQLNFVVSTGAVVHPGGSSGAQWAAGAFVHHTNGVVFTLLFAVLLWHRIPALGTATGNPIKGLVYGTALGLLATVILIPYVYFAKAGLDPFSFGLPFPLEQPSGAVYTAIGWKLPFAIMVWHWTYGLFVGLLLNPSNES